uniref:Uncharacterized protein n=1 Tax=Ananas comosus var. bracteatus TaxID=296719 RepID=A0A6V7P6G6_ANACO|nr:unnamed protein product [Ananas comosus var. bracteatus]
MGNPIHPIPSPSPRPPPPTTASAATSRTSGATAASSDDGAPQQPMLKRTPISLVQPPRRRRPIRLSRPLRVFRSLCRTLPIFSPKCGHLPAPCKLPSQPSTLLPPPTSTSPPPPSPPPPPPPPHTATTTTTTTTAPPPPSPLHPRHRHPLRSPQGPRLPLPPAEPALPPLPRGGARHADPGAPPGDGLGHGARGARVREAPWRRRLRQRQWQWQGPAEAAPRGAAVDDVLQREKERVWRAEGGDGGGLGGDGDAEAGVDGAGVMPAPARPEGADGAMAYVRAFFEHVVGSRDSETLYMISPDGGNGPELTIFFIRI